MGRPRSVLNHLTQLFTLNFWNGCNKISQECINCLIGPMLKRGGRHDPFDGPRLTRPEVWLQARTWQREAERDNRLRTIFVCGMSDFFHSMADPWRELAWDVIRECDLLAWRVLTKRSDRILEHLPADWGEGWDHVELGVTCGIKSSLRRVDDLLKVPAKRRFIVAEPLLGPVDFRPYLATGLFDWLSTAEERCTKHARRTDPAWVADIAEQCDEFNVEHLSDCGRQGPPVACAAIA